MKVIESLNDIFKYGAFSLPAVNYLSCEGNIQKDCREILCILKLAWKGKFKEALEKIDKTLKNYKSETVKYILLANKLVFLKYTGQLNLDLYRYLKRKLPKMSKSIRDTVIVTLISFEADKVNSLRKVRVWKNDYRKSTLSFLYLSLARREASSGRFSKAVHNYIQAYKQAKEIPHPTCIVSSLNDLAWDIKEKHPRLAYKISQGAAFWLGYYRESPGNLFGVIDTLFVTEKIINAFSIYKTSKIIKSLEVPKRYEKLLKEAEKYIPKFDVSIYVNTKSLRKSIRELIEPYRKEKVSTGRISEIITTKEKRIRGNTLRKILDGKRVESLKFPYPLYNEYIKILIKKQFEEALKKLKQIPLSERERFFICTYTAQVERTKFYLSRKDKFKETYKLLGDIEKFGKHMARRYETMNFVVEMIKAHPYVEGRKAVVKKAIDKIEIKKLRKIIQRYIELDEPDRKLIDSFLRNYGRYDGIELGISLKAPEVVREFAKKYQLKIQPTILAFWCVDDKRTRGRLERVLRKISV